MEDALSCSFCKEKFSDVVKSIPECGNNICGRCYDDLKEDLDDETNKYQCLGCGERHVLPASGLRDNKPFLALLKKMKPAEKPLHPNAKKLKELLIQVNDQMERVKSFDGKQVVELECDQLEQDVGNAIESAIDHLKETGKLMMKQISDYREKCLKNLPDKSTETNDTKNEELASITNEVREFNEKWEEYFKRIEVYATENEIEDALLRTAKFMSAIEWMEDSMRKEALNWEKMVFKGNLKFLEEWNQVGEIEIIAESNHPIQSKKLRETSNPVNSTPPKKMTIQETPSFTLTGHSNWVRQVLFLPDGRLASCSDDATIKIWNAENGKELFKLSDHNYCPFTIVLLPNGHLASGSFDNTIKVWDLEQRKEIRTIQAHSYWVVSLRVLKNGNLASYSLDHSIKIWNLNSKENNPVSTMRGHGNTYHLTLQLFGVLSNDYLVTCSRPRPRKFQNNEDSILRVWNPNESNPIKSVSTGLNDARLLLVLSNDQVVLGFEKSGTIKIIDLNDNALSRTNERAHDDGVFSLAQLSNGNLVSAGQDGSNWTIKAWNLIDWSLLQTTNTSHSNWVSSLSISSDERYLASGSRDNTIKMWPISTN